MLLSGAIHRPVRLHPLIAEHFATVDGYTGTIEALNRVADAIRDRQHALRARRDDYAELKASVTEALRTGAPLPDALDTAAPPPDVSPAIATLERVRAELGREHDAIVQEAVDGALEHLHDLLTSVVDEARAVTSVAGLTAAEAIAADRVADWKRLDGLRSRYEHIRLAQASLLGHGGVADGTFIARGERWSVIQNVPAVYETWVGWRPDGTGSTVDMTGWSRTTADPALAPWPPDPGSQFDWVIAHPDAIAWVPTRPQMAEVVARAREFESKWRETNDGPLKPGQSGFDNPVATEEHTFKRQLARAAAWQTFLNEHDRRRGDNLARQFDA